jgi:hypothetical protein
MTDVSWIFIDVGAVMLAVQHCRFNPLSPVVIPLQEVAIGPGMLRDANNKVFGYDCTCGVSAV